MIASESLSDSEAIRIKIQFISDLKKSQILSSNEKQVNIAYVEIY